MEISVTGWFLTAGCGVSTALERRGGAVFEMQRLAQCPVNFNRVCNGTNQELRVGIYFKPAFFTRSRGDTVRIEKKAIVCGFPIIPCKSL